MLCVGTQEPDLPGHVLPLARPSPPRGPGCVPRGRIRPLSSLVRSRRLSPNTCDFYRCCRKGCVRQ